MTSAIRINMYLLLIIGCFLTLNINGMPTMAFANPNNNNNNIFLLRHKYYSAPEPLSSNLFANSPSLSSSHTERRSVIMPRLCYFARVSKGGIHQKLCLPYRDDDES